jgi:hypothetical protein
VDAAKVEDGEEELEDRAVVLDDVGGGTVTESTVEDVKETEKRLALGTVERGVKADDGGVDRLRRELLRSGGE